MPWKDISPILFSRAYELCFQAFPVEVSAGYAATLRLSAPPMPTLFTTETSYEGTEYRKYSSFYRAAEKNLCNYIEFLLTDDEVKRFKERLIF